jgi:hypothetical protein
MTIAQLESSTAPAGASSAQCAMCDHEMVAHDAIGRRYCAATQAQALGRNCICRPA